MCHSDVCLDAQRGLGLCMYLILINQQPQYSLLVFIDILVLTVHRLSWGNFRKKICQQSRQQSRTLESSGTPALSLTPALFSSSWLERVWQCEWLMRLYIKTCEQCNSHAACVFRIGERSDNTASLQPGRFLDSRFSSSRWLQFELNLPTDPFPSLQSTSCLETLFDFHNASQPFIYPEQVDQWVKNNWSFVRSILGLSITHDAALAVYLKCVLTPWGDVWWYRHDSESDCSRCTDIPTTSPHWHTVTAKVLYYLYGLNRVVENKGIVP